MITPISFTGKNYSNYQNSKKNVEKNLPDNKNISNTPASVNKLGASLIALAAIGASVLQSCSDDDIFDTYEQNQQPKTEQVDFKNLSTANKLDLTLKALDLYAPYESVSRYDNVNFSDENGTKISYEPTEVGKRYLKLDPLRITPDTIRLKETKVSPDSFNESTLRATSKRDSLFLDTEKDNEIINRKLYMMNNTNDTISEFKYDNGSYVETSKLTKNPEGGFIQILPNGDIKSYRR